ncbi:MAG: hypothetical protein M1524_02270 [Patescibacteria group bacterium]|nr:hypothetical protein [Patescibacteria group bacterium]
MHRFLEGGPTFISEPELADYCGRFDGGEFTDCGREYRRHAIKDSPPFTGESPYAWKEYDIWRLGQEAQACYITRKARTVKMLESIPESLRIPQVVFPFNNIRGIKSSAEEMVRNGKEVGIRTCFSDGETKDRRSVLGKSPWVMGLKTPDQVDDFFSPELQTNAPWRGSDKTPENNFYFGWINSYRHQGLREIIVMGNPPGLGEIDLKREHFVCAVYCTGNEYRTELITQTDQLRDIEDTDRKSLLYISTKIPEIKLALGSFSLEEICVSPGNRYLDSSGSPENKQLNPHSLKLVEQIIGVLYRQHGANLYYTLSALNNFAIGAVEFQGRTDKDGNIKWILAYGLKGLMEDLTRLSSIAKETKQGD